MKSKQYEGYPEINKKGLRPQEAYQVTYVIERMGKNDEECRKCPDYPSEKNNYKLCECMRTDRPNTYVCPRED